MNWILSFFLTSSLLSLVSQSFKHQKFNPIFIANPGNAKAAQQKGSRWNLVSETLQSSAGVYVNKAKGLSLSLNRTVFLSVAAFNQENIAHYKIYFKNFLCFVKHYDIDLLLYVVHHDISNLEKEINDLEMLGIRVLTYPDELFWQLVASKTTKVNTGKGFADYTGSVPSFASFGALVMLVPILEVLEMGYNVIYFDVDIGLVQDPVPFLTLGNADFVTSIEMRHCPEYFTLSKAETKWETLEPNTGVMHLRATQQGKTLFRAWLEHIVHGNVMNDQRAFDRSLLRLTYRSDCNSVKQSVSAEREAADADRPPTYCFLSEALFQNGMIAVQCPTKSATRDDWLLGMDLHGTVGRSSLTNGTLEARFPVAVHVNYCKGKSHELQVRGLWLLSDQHNESICKPFKQTDTYYSLGLNWTAEVQRIQKAREALFISVLRNGTLLQRTGGKEVYLVDLNHHLRQIPDKDTFESLFGEDWSIVRTVPTNTLERFTIGKPFEKVK